MIKLNECVAFSSLTKILYLLSSVICTTDSQAAANPNIYCDVGYSRVEPERQFLTASDSFGTLDFELIKQPSNLYVGKATYRFLNDEDIDPRGGPFGISARGFFLPGNPASIEFSALEYDSLAPDAKARVFSNLNAEFSSSGILENLGFQGAKYFELQSMFADPFMFDFKKAVRTGLLIKNDLTNIGIRFCKVTYPK
jgi:hypothetical protein